jgi:hypothetical protein
MTEPLPGSKITIKDLRKRVIHPRFTFSIFNSRQSLYGTLKWNDVWVRDEWEPVIEHGRDYGTDNRFFPGWRCK